MDTMTNGVIAAVNAIDGITAAVERAPGRCWRALQAAAAADATTWGEALEGAARRAAAVLAVLIVAGQVAAASGRWLWRCGAALAEASYELGGLLRQAIDARADQLAALWVAVLVGPATAPAADAVVIAVPLLLPCAPVAGLLPPAREVVATSKRRSTAGTRRRRRATAVAA